MGWADILGRAEAEMYDYLSTRIVGKFYRDELPGVFPDVSIPIYTARVVGGGEPSDQIVQNYEIAGGSDGSPCQQITGAEIVGWAPTKQQARELFEQIINALPMPEDYTKPLSRFYMTDLPRIETGTIGVQDRDGVEKTIWQVTAACEAQLNKDVS